MASPYVMSLAHALVLRRIADHPGADAVTIAAALRWPLVVVEQLVADLEQQGMIAPPTRH
ncbi:MAG: MarR family transcriptional regulator [Deltaproteobacteria bacterium]|nr:MAG: MarR family transcriptional regulator [Deltaproteobacteria bacterium]TMA58176.1 MAG: MarR family transcriptional regulator [Deltaproteobacteria bacterium]